MEIPGCATGSHSLEKPVQPAQAAPTGPVPVATGKTADGKEVYGGAVPGAESSSASAINATAVPAPLSEQFAGDKKPLAPKSTPYVEEQDDPDIGVPSGARCKRKACGKEYEGGSREGEVCEYHPGMVSAALCPPSIAPQLLSVEEKYTAHLPRGLEGLLVLQAPSARL